MEIRKIDTYNENEILPLYKSVGWTAYTDSPDALREGFRKALLTLGAYRDGKLMGLVRTVGDGHTVILIQDILVYPEFHRQGIGTALLQEVLRRFSYVRQVQLTTDNTPKTCSFYKSLGFRELSELGCRGFMKG